MNSLRGRVIGGSPACAGVRWSLALACHRDSSPRTPTHPGLSGRLDLASSGAPSRTCSVLHIRSLEPGWHRHLAVCPPRLPGRTSRREQLGGRPHGSSGAGRRVHRRQSPGCTRRRRVRRLQHRLPRRARGGVQHIAPMYGALLRAHSLGGWLSKTRRRQFLDRGGRTPATPPLPGIRGSSRPRGDPADWGPGRGYAGGVGDAGAMRFKRDFATTRATSMARASSSEYRLRKVSTDRLPQNSRLQSSFASVSTSS